MKHGRSHETSMIVPKEATEVAFDLEQDIRHVLDWEKVLYESDKIRREMLRLTAVLRKDALVQLSHPGAHNWEVFSQYATSAERVLFGFAKERIRPMNPADWIIYLRALRLPLANIQKNWAWNQLDPRTKAAFDFTERDAYSKAYSLRAVTENLVMSLCSDGSMETNRALFESRAADWVTQSLRTALLVGSALYGIASLRRRISKAIDHVFFVDEWLPVESLDVKSQRARRHAFRFDLRTAMTVDPLYPPLGAAAPRTTPDDKAPTQNEVRTYQYSSTVGHVGVRQYDLETLFGENNLQPAELDRPASLAVLFFYAFTHLLQAHTFQQTRSLRYGFFYIDTENFRAELNHHFAALQAVAKKYLSEKLGDLSNADQVMDAMINEMRLENQNLMRPAIFQSKQSLFVDFDAIRAIWEYGLSVLRNSGHHSRSRKFEVDVQALIDKSKYAPTIEARRAFPPLKKITRNPSQQLGEYDALAQLDSQTLLAIDCKSHILSPQYLDGNFIETRRVKDGTSKQLDHFRQFIAKVQALRKTEEFDLTGYLVLPILVTSGIEYHECDDYVSTSEMKFPSICSFDELAAILGGFDVVGHLNSIYP
jgi:hypothetical protein